MPEISCNYCTSTIMVWAKMPLRVINEDGRQAIPTDYSPVYEHIHDTHPEQWTVELAAEFEQQKLT